MEQFSFHSQSFVNLLSSQTSHNLEFESLDTIRFSSPSADEQSSKQRNKWIPHQDLVLISVWLNTSKDPIVGNEQKAGTFWKRICDYYNGSPLVLRSREWSQCKQRWGRINENVCKFVGSYEAALKEQSSGQNENDVMKAAHEIYFNDYKVKFTMDHAWRELRHDQKWSTTYMKKDGGPEKRKTLVDDDGSEEVSQTRPLGVKACKAAKRKKNPKEQAITQLENILEKKDKLNKQKILERLHSKSEPLYDIKRSLKTKLMQEML